MTSNLPSTFCDTQAVPAIECQAIVALYESTKGPDSTWITSSLNTDSVCEWPGVDCRGSNHIARLFLDNKGLSGSLPAQLGDLTHLTWLQLNDNSIAGTIPSTLGELSLVTWLRLEDNQLSGTIPSQLFGMSSLENLYLSSNDLTGTLPTELENSSSATNLGRLYLGGNTALTGGLPALFPTYFPTLGSITLSDTGLEGAFPDTLVQWSNLDYLHYLGSKLCAPTTPVFADWLDTVDGVFGDNCEDAAVVVNVPTLAPFQETVPTQTPIATVVNTPTLAPFQETVPTQTPIATTADPSPSPTPGLGDPTSQPQEESSPAPNQPTDDTQNYVNLCQGFITDRDPRPLEPLNKPGYLKTVVDPLFQSTIRRITDIEATVPPGEQAVIKPMYSTIQAWNADESYLILYQRGQGHVLLNGLTYQRIRSLSDSIRPADIEEIFWDFANPDLLYYSNPSTQELMRYSVSTDTSTSLHSFADICQGAGIEGGNDVQMMSWDSDTIGLRCTQEPSQFFGYTISSDTVTPILTSGVGNNFSPWIAPQATPSGNSFVVDATVLDANMKVVRTLNLKPEHSSMGRFRNGTDGLFTVAFAEGPLEGGCGPGALVAHDLTTGSCRTLVGQDNGYPYPPSNIHMSALSHLNPGWVAVSIVGVANWGQTENTGQELLDNELLLVDTSGDGNVCRIGHHRSWGRGGSLGYWAEPHVVISPTATRILFGSDWNGGGSVDSYVLELPAYNNRNAVTTQSAQPNPKADTSTTVNPNIDLEAIQDSSVTMSGAEFAMSGSRSWILLSLSLVMTVGRL